MSIASVLLLGDPEQREFREACQGLDACSDVRRASTVAEAQAVLADGFAADVIVIAQRRPGEFSREQVDRLRREAPLARVVGLLGSWCEGEARSGEPWPAALRVYWHQWAPRLQQELRRIAGDTCPDWGLPLTASDEDRLLLADGSSRERREGAVAILAASYEMEAWLADACRARGYTPLPSKPNHGGGSAQDEQQKVLAALWVGGTMTAGEASRLRRDIDRVAPARVVALLPFPRWEDRRRALDGGATSVLSLPVRLGDLYEELDQAAGFGQDVLVDLGS